MVSGYTSEYGQRVKLARRAAGLTQTELGDAVSLSRASVGNVEAGRQATSAEQTAQLAEVLGVPPGWLLVGDSSWTPPAPKLSREQMRQIAARLREYARAMEIAAAPYRPPTPPQAGPSGAKTRPPWDGPTVAALNAFQASGTTHPFTCPRDHDTPGEAKLVATVDGWVCSHTPACGYTQDWAHTFMTGDLA